MEQNYWISVYKNRSFLKPYVFKTFRQTEEEMLQLVELLLTSHQVRKVEVQGVKTGLWNEYTITYEE